MTDKVAILVVDDHPLFRQGVVNVFSVEPDFEVVGQTDNGEAALTMIRQLQPEIAVLDVNLPDMNGQQVMRQVVAEKLPTRVILLTAYDDESQMAYAMRGGAAAYCSKDIRPETLVWVIRQVRQGKHVLGEQILEPAALENWLAAQVDGGVRAYRDPGETYAPLSAREMEVLIYVTKGMSNKEIAALLRISHQTVKNHITAILHKLNVEDRTQAAIYALRRGWIRLSQQDKQSQE
ncbi:MAG TPA: response regulator transcription factor [Anaerolineales bacterium]|nr:response regulator transcription factor [Anaerolineales bacterium]